MPAGDETFLVAGLAVAAHDGPHVVDEAGGLLPDRAEQGGAALALAAHPARRVIDEADRDARERGIIFERKPGPVTRIRATGTTALAVEDCRALKRVLGRLPDQAACRLRTAILPERLSFSVSNDTF